MLFPSSDSATAYDPTPSIERVSRATVEVARSTPSAARCLGVFVSNRGELPGDLDLDRAAASAVGFEGELGQTLILPRTNAPTRILIGIGNPDGLDAAKLRDLGATFARAAGKHTKLAVPLIDVEGVTPAVAAQALVEGALLSRYRYDTLKSGPHDETPLELTVVVTHASIEDVSRGVFRAQITARATLLARDLANSPPSQLTATRMGEIAKEVGAAAGIEVEVFDRDALVRLGCGGILGVNRGSSEPPRMIRLTYRPKNERGEAIAPMGHLALVGKGVMYDSGGISLKPGDEMHAEMKLDMSGAAAVLASIAALPELGCRAMVTGYMMCTDNMPSGTAMKLGDILTIRGGKTIEVRNTDAEGRLMLADGLVLATEQKPDAIVDIATLTGACMRALGTGLTGVIGNHQPFVEQVFAAATRSDERVWQLPLERGYRSYLDSAVADMKNVGPQNAAAITAALFLEEFVDGVPWAHLDICGPMIAETDESWRSKGATGVGTRLLIELATNFSRPVRRGAD